jgi:hypothetical protein
MTNLAKWGNRVGQAILSPAKGPRPKQISAFAGPVAPYNLS